MALWNFTIDDASPYLSYSPFVDGTNGWKTWYSQSQFNTVPDEVGRGNSYHIAPQINANVSFRFYGSGISLSGSANNTFNIIVDNILRASVNGTSTSLIYSDYNFTEGSHDMTLSVLPSNSNTSLSFDSVIVSSPLGSDQNPPSPRFYDNSDTASLFYSGAWSINNVNGVPNSTISAPFHVTTESGASASLSFTGGIAVVVRGMMGSENGLYSVSLDGSTSIFNGTSLWSVPDALLFFRAGLDPGATHEINITNISAGTRLCLNSMMVFQNESKVTAIPSSLPTPAKPSNSVNLGIIIGPIAGLLIIAIAVAYIFYRRQSIKPSTPTLIPFIEGRSGVGEDPSLTSARPPFWANSETLLSPVGSSSGLSSLSEASLKKQHLLMGRHGQSTMSLVKMTRLNTALADDNGLHADVRISPSGETTFSNTVPISPHRKPLPTIPVPSYNAALQASELASEGIKSLEDILGRSRHVRRKTQETAITAPPQYER